VTYHWIKGQIEKEVGGSKGGADLKKYAHSMVVSTLAPTTLGTLRQADGEEGLADTSADASAVVKANGFAHTNGHANGHVKAH
jgi:hypothetical protein